MDGDDSLDLDALSDTKLDEQLKSLRDRLHLVTATFQRIIISGLCLTDLAVVNCHQHFALKNFKFRMQVGKESAELARELQALERQSLSSNQSAGSIDEVLRLNNEHDGTNMFQGIVINLN